MGDGEGRTNWEGRYGKVVTAISTRLPMGDIIKIILAWTAFRVIYLQVIRIVLFIPLLFELPLFVS